MRERKACKIEAECITKNYIQHRICKNPSIQCSYAYHANSLASSSTRRLPCGTTLSSGSPKSLVLVL